ncbi:MAG: response regulator transcription factor [Proteobacteria bacterium]|jgi:DNA-binding response OmpR family regulator|nr:response regulator transcription factor [Desulfocapsa sp.]MBU3945262.1 response regulator transcription factor [Pseudomonadota bacterium]MCG2744880.1 response regulator transcription factor [Desulfobacteraceae bacterium]MBU3982472.1 response regulator transcription factor [Pseudomonadota bacterium]MBU4028851.1 response regulator transcription factor [Pseudomonadota bacterium]
MRILVIEDEKRLAAILKKGLEESGFVVDVALDGEDGLFMARTYPYDAVLLDILLPKVDGLTVLKKLRAKKIGVPVLMLTAKGELEDRVRGLNLGADDYLVKPFDFLELLARLNTVIRRSMGKASPIIVIDDLSLDMSAKTVTRSGKEINLSAKEYNLLEYLALNSGRVIGRTELTEHLYDTEFDLDSNIIDVYINYLRNKIDKGYDRQLIVTVRGAGYVLKGEQ